VGLQLAASSATAACTTVSATVADMHLSTRTVESHLQRAYEKLGIASGRELPGALRDQTTS
jgi:DNA-binding NarL/FixJ family response regulator